MASKSDDSVKPKPAKKDSKLPAAVSLHTLQPGADLANFKRGRGAGGGGTWCS